MTKKATLLEARVKDDYRNPSVTAFGGREYVKGVWRIVPEGQADSAAAHPYLELREAGNENVAEAKDKPVEDESVAEAKPATASRRGKS